MPETRPLLAKPVRSSDDLVTDTHGLPPGQAAVCGTGLDGVLAAAAATRLHPHTERASPVPVAERLQVSGGRAPAPAQEEGTTSVWAALFPGRSGKGAGEVLQGLLKVLFGPGPRSLPPRLIGRRKSPVPGREATVRTALRVPGRKEGTRVTVLSSNSQLREDGPHDRGSEDVVSGWNSSQGARSYVACVCEITGSPQDSVVTVPIATPLVSGEQRHRQQRNSAPATRATRSSADRDPAHRAQARLLDPGTALPLWVPLWWPRRELGQW